VQRPDQGSESAPRTIAARLSPALAGGCSRRSARIPETMVPIPPTSPQTTFTSKRGDSTVWNVDGFNWKLTMASTNGTTREEASNPQTRALHARRRIGSMGRRSLMMGTRVSRPAKPARWMAEEGARSGPARDRSSSPALAGSGLAGSRPPRSPRARAAPPARAEARRPPASARSRPRGAPPLRRGPPPARSS
jgi:hypothetical protein